MRKFLFTLAAVCTLVLFNAACALAAFGPGQRTIELLGGALNSDKHTRCTLWCSKPST